MCGARGKWGRPGVGRCMERAGQSVVGRVRDGGGPGPSEVRQIVVGRGSTAGGQQNAASGVRAGSRVIQGGFPEQVPLEHRLAGYGRDFLGF